MRLLLVLLLVLTVVSVASAQTPTPGASELIYATLTGGQPARFDYVTTATDVHIANLLTLVLISMWSMFFTVLLVIARGKDK